MTEPIKIRASVAGDDVSVRVLMPHPMESGNRKDPAGGLRPAHFITDVVVTCNDVVVLQAQFGPSVSKDPLLAFKFRGGKPGNTIRVVWNDNKGASLSASAQIAV